MNFLGLIFQCENGKFVKVEKEGIFEYRGMIIDGYAGREITQLGKPIQDYIVWNKKGIAWAKEWNLLKTLSNDDPTRLPDGWPKG